MDAIRPNPDQLLASVASQESKRKRGKLRLFFGMAAGVGKTYAMLKAAREQLRQGTQLCIGIVETHGRPETEALLGDIPILPRKKIEYRGTLQEEMDLDAILARKPQLVLVDELAHSNLPGGRHEKRYQDVVEILEAGIDVYSTMNVQHLESRADVVALLTAVRIQETVPDSVLDLVDQIDLIDLTPHALIQRLKDGKVYPGRMTQQALEYFFQEGNLTALREIALRVTAKKVERDMQGFQALRSTNKLLVAVSHSPFSEKLIRTARRLVEDLEIPWVAIHVDTGKVLKSEDHNQLVKNLSLAEEMGAEIATLHGTDVAETIRDYAKAHQVVQMIVGRPSSPRHSGLRGSRFIQNLIRKNPDIDITILQGVEKKSQKSKKGWGFFGLRQVAWNWNVALQALAWVSLTAIPAYLLDPYLGYRAVGFIFLLSILLSSVRLPFSAVFLEAILSAVVWNYFFIPPLYDFSIRAPEDIMMLLTYFVITLTSGFLTSKIRRNQKILQEREERTRTLYEILKPMTLVQGVQAVVQSALSKMEGLFQAQCGILLAEGGQLEEKLFLGSLSLSEKERSVAQWCYQHGQMAGWSTETLPLSDILCLALKSGEEKFGVLVLRPRENMKLNPDQESLLISITNQIAIAFAKKRHDEETQEANLLKESEKLHQTLFNCVSHELRTPLTAIMGAATVLQSQVQGLEASASLQGLSEEIVSASERLNHIFENLLDVTRLESGLVKLKQEWFDLSELIQESLGRHRKLLSHHEVQCDLPQKPVYFFGDFELLEHAVSNILLNAAHYSPLRSKIKIRVEAGARDILVQVSDEGSGIPEALLSQVFEKFYRLPGTATGGLGLGLSITKNLVELHHGRIVAENNARGVSVTMSFPRPETPPALRGLEA